MDNVIDLLLLEWNKKYPALKELKDKIEDDESLSEQQKEDKEMFSKVRRELNEILDAVEILYSYKKGKR